MPEQSSYLSVPSGSVASQPGAINLSHGQLTNDMIVTISTAGQPFAQTTLGNLALYILGDPMPLALSSAVVDIGDAGDNVIVAGTPGKQIFVHRVTLALVDLTTVQFKSGATPISGPMSLTALLLDVNTTPYYACATGADLVLSLGGGIACGGTIDYDLV